MPPGSRRLCFEVTPEEFLQLEVAICDIKLGGRYATDASTYDRPDRRARLEDDRRHRDRARLRAEAASPVARVVDTKNSGNIHRISPHGFATFNHSSRLLSVSHAIRRVTRALWFRDGRDSSVCERHCRIGH